MKVPLTFQNTEYDCCVASFVNALNFLFEREEVPVQLIKIINQYTLDERGSNGVIGEGGTSYSAAAKSLRRHHFFAYLLAHPLQSNSMDLSLFGIAPLYLNIAHLFATHLIVLRYGLSEYF